MEVGSIREGLARARNANAPAVERVSETERLTDTLELLVSRLNETSIRLHNKADSLLGPEPPSEVSEEQVTPETAMARLHFLGGKLQGIANSLDSAAGRLSNI